jgi:hypothetical protein
MEAVEAAAAAVADGRLTIGRIRQMGYFLAVAVAVAVAVASAALTLMMTSLMAGAEAVAAVVERKSPVCLLTED